ncbi:hypothetical protein FPV67DRAFT_1663957 [Lyophyllum atratum]|nr:hypothetical protein FPV67DRAFT_1663957 [Lyophyllum atratum]
MSSQSFAAEQLLELLLQLKKTTPAAARSILNGQPQIAYALMTLMVTMNAVNFEVFQKTLAEFGTKAQPTPAIPSIPPSAHPSAHPSASSTPVPALPPHLHPQAQQYRTATPPTGYPGPYQNGHAQQPPPHHHHQHQHQAPPFQQPPSAGYGYAQPQHAPGPYGGYPGYGTPAQTPVPAPTPPTSNVMSDTLAAIPDEQKARAVFSLFNEMGSNFFSGGSGIDYACDYDDA